MDLNVCSNMQKIMINIFYFFVFVQGKIVQLPTKNYEPQRINVPLNIPNIWGGNTSARKYIKICC